jgi:hypothetical protein
MNRYSKEKDIEICAVKLHFSSHTVVIVSVYGSPAGRFSYFLNNLEIALNPIYDNSIDIILCGDFNINYLTYNHNKQLVDSLLTTYNLYSTVNFATRICNGSNTAIDNIFINIFRNGSFSVRLLINGLSDHDTQVISLSNFNIPDNKNALYICSKINRQSLNEFQLHLSYELWEDVFSDDDTNIIFNKFLNTFLIHFYASFLKKRMKFTHNPKAWITTGIKTLFNNKRKLYVICRESHDPELKTYKNYCKTLSEVIITAKKLYYSNKLSNSENKSKTTWSIIRTITSNKKNVNNISMMKINDKLTSNHQIIGDNFNKYFASVAANINNNNYANNTNFNSSKNSLLSYLYSAFKQPFTNIKLKYTTINEIEKIIKELKNKNSYGYDEITTKILKISSPFIVSPLTYICNRMLSTRIFPDRLKYSEVKPIYKKGDKSSTSNYRPITLFPAFSKIFEKILCKRLYQHITTNNILTKEQYGFRCNSS